MYRGLGIGSELIRKQISKVGEMIFPVSIDNIACLQMCFRAGLHAKRLIKKQGRRPSLLFEGGTPIKEGEKVATTRTGHFDVIFKR